MKTRTTIALTVVLLLAAACCKNDCGKGQHAYNGIYEGEYTNRIAFPIGGMGAGMFCWEGSGAISNMSLRHRPNVFSEPHMFGAIHVKGVENGTKVLEGPVPDWKKFGMPHSAIGGDGWWGLPRFDKNTFGSRFPFATIQLTDKDIPLNVEMTAWSPFIPTDQDNSSLPVGAIEYTFTNPTSKPIEAVFSYNAENFMKIRSKSENSSIKKIPNGYILSQDSAPDHKEYQGDFAIYTDDENTKVDYCWFRGSWFDPVTMAWNNLSEGIIPENDPVDKAATGASLFVPVNMEPGGTKTVRLYMAWYVPNSDLRQAGDARGDIDYGYGGGSYPVKCETPRFYEPWYSHRFGNINEVADYWHTNYDDLKKNSQLFTDAFYGSSLPPEVLEAVSANLSILKSPTVMRQHDGRMWNWEGTGDTWGSCHGSCTHVWNYAQAVPHLFPAMERSLRETEFFINQDKEGHQVFRAGLPIRTVEHTVYAAADGQLGGIVKIYRDWRISGDMPCSAALSKNSEWPSLCQSDMWMCEELPE